MPRLARGLVDGFTYHILNRGNGGQEVFRKDQDYRVFAALMDEAKTRYSVEIFGYCSLPNHFPIVVMPPRAEELSKWMQWLMTSHVRRYHRHYGTSGHVWQGRFKSFLIQEDAHLLTVLRYVESNPVRAGLVSSAREWPWSSHRESIGHTVWSLIDEIPIELPKDWGGYVDAPLIKRALDTLRKSVNRQSSGVSSIFWRTPLSMSAICWRSGVPIEGEQGGRLRLRGGISRAPKKVTLRGIVARISGANMKGFLGTILNEARGVIQVRTGLSLNLTPLTSTC